jgi:predicted Zn-dependent protease with MMP-like domain
MNISDETFEKIIADALDSLPEKYTKHMSNVAVVYQDEPSTDQRKELKLRCHQSLFGLYQGIPLPQRGAGYNLVLPDKITLFKNPLLSVSANEQELRAQVKHTLWHELAHHFGLDHGRIHWLEEKHRV